MNSQSQEKNSKGERVLRMRELSQRLQLSPSRLYALIADGQFLRPFRLVSGGRAAGWLESEVDQWLASRRADEDMSEIGKVETRTKIECKSNSTCPCSKSGTNGEFHGG